MRWGNGFLIHIRKYNMYIIYIYTNTHTYVHAYTHIHINIHTCIHIHTYIHACMYARTHARMHPLPHTNTYTQCPSHYSSPHPSNQQSMHRLDVSQYYYKGIINTTTHGPIIKSTQTYDKKKTCNQRIEVEGFSYNSIFLIV
jgi:hypothetical protein